MQLEVILVGNRIATAVLSKVFSLDKLSCPQICNIEQEKDRKLNEKNGSRDLERGIKNKGDIFLLEE